MNSNSRSILFKGFQFGMLLQLAIGPVSLFIFDIASKEGFVPGATGAIAATLVDALFVLFASLGVASFLEKKQARLILKIFGAAILALFGLSIIFEVFGWRIIPELKFAGETPAQSSFIKSLIITISSPLTILFWAGVFSAKIAEANYRQKDLALFGAGAVLATLLCQMLVALIGSIMKQFLPGIIISSLNVGVGLSLLYFAFRLIKGEQKREI